MDRQPILFRCDANARQGWETLQRTLTFASSCHRQRRPIYIGGCIEPFPVISQIPRTGNEYLAMQNPIGTSEDCDDTIRTIRKLKAAIVVICGDNIPESYLRELVSTGTMVVSYTTTSGGRFPSKLVINPYLMPTVNQYRVEAGTQVCAGRRYATVRGIFRRQRPMRVQEPQGAVRAILALSDNDTGESLKRANQMLAMPNIDKLSVFTRTYNPALDELRGLASQSQGKLEVLTEVNEWMTRLNKSLFAVSAGDSWCLDFACVGLPQFVITQCAEHRANAKRLDEEGAALYLGESAKVSAELLQESIQAMLEDPLERATMTRAARNLIDGRGPDRMVAALEIMVRQPAAVPGLRIAA